MFFFFKQKTAYEISACLVGSEMCIRDRYMGRVAQLAVPTLIVSGLEPFALEKALTGEHGGTWIMPEKNAVSKRKFWMAYNSEPVGSVWIDQGAARALLEGGKSLLPAGISRVEGKFGKGALVRILDFQGQTLGVGLSNYAAQDLRHIMGRKSSDIPEILGPGMYAEVVHRDNMLLDAALQKRRSSPPTAGRCRKRKKPIRSPAYRNRNPPGLRLQWTQAFFFRDLPSVHLPVPKPVILSAFCHEARVIIARYAVASWSGHIRNFRMLPISEHIMFRY
eukprot:TRINITY_DN4890_c0_g2_i1.p1 TRINITY_DN4890_c0_g2~~TRINITY_DN4890_c0_g2_i1.p1  ORF type:complete len:278 (+),score=50.86 TRINITY_DN4890_c0_g2_i1:3-836(+)